MEAVAGAKVIFALSHKKVDISKVVTDFENVKVAR